MQQDESPAQRAARLRREKREKRILEEGNARLDKITSLSGRPANSEPLPNSQNTEKAHEDDPDEVVLSNLDFGMARSANPRIPFPNAASQFDPGLRPSTPQLPSSRSHSPAPQDQDPLTTLLQQMLGEANSNGQGPDLASAFGVPSSNVPTNLNLSKSSLIWWKLLHVVPTIFFGCYLTIVCEFSGNALSRVLANTNRLDAMWIFITMQLILQATSLFYGPTASPPTGLIGSITSFVPEPFRGYIFLALRYGRMYTAFSTDALILIFMLGTAAWLKQGNTS